MTLLGFNERFVPAIESRAKRHTIRALGKSGVCRFKVGDHVQLYRMVRQKGMRKIVDVDPVCTKVEPICISTMIVGRFPTASISIDDRGLTVAEAESLAVADGFTDANALIAFFCPYPSDQFQEFTGHVIHWDWL